MGDAIRKSLSAAFLTAVLVFGFALAGTLIFGIVRAATNVTGIIYSDITWTKANGSSSLTGPVGVHKGLTLTIEPGTTVNFNDYYIVVNGTVRAQGSSTDHILLNGGQITFTSVSNSWNEQMGSGSITENAVLNSEIEINDSSPKISSNSINARSLLVVHQ